jgi:DNA-binding transcriptional MerR regulator
MAKAQEAFRTISEVSDDLHIPKHVLRFWESKFTQLKPMKRGGGRRYYRPEDLELLAGIHHLLHSAGYTIRGVQKIFRERGVEAVKGFALRFDNEAEKPISARARTLDGLITEVRACLELANKAEPLMQKSTARRAT